MHVQTKISNHFVHIGKIVVNMLTQKKSRTMSRLFLNFYPIRSKQHASSTWGYAQVGLLLICWFPFLWFLFVTFGIFSKFLKLIFEKNCLKCPMNRPKSRKSLDRIHPKELKEGLRSRPYLSGRKSPFQGMVCLLDLKGTVTWNIFFSTIFSQSMLLWG